MKISATQAATIRKSILQTGIHLIRQNGPAVGIQEIADKAKIPKGSFYNYFSSKDQFLIEALEEYTQNAILWNDQTLEKRKTKIILSIRTKSKLRKEIFARWYFLSNQCTFSILFSKTTKTEEQTKTLFEFYLKRNFKFSSIRSTKLF